MGSGKKESIIHVNVKLSWPDIIETQICPEEDSIINIVSENLMVGKQRLQNENKYLVIRTKIHKNKKYIFPREITGLALKIFHGPSIMRVP